MCVTIRPDLLVLKESPELPPCLSQAYHVFQHGVGLVLGTTCPKRAGNALRLATMKVESTLPWAAVASPHLYGSVGLSRHPPQSCTALQREQLRHLAKTSQTWKISTAPLLTL